MKILQLKFTTHVKRTLFQPKAPKRHDNIKYYLPSQSSLLPFTQNWSIIQKNIQIIDTHYTDKLNFISASEFDFAFVSQGKLKPKQRNVGTSLHSWWKWFRNFPIFMEIIFSNIYGEAIWGHCLQSLGIVILLNYMSCAS